MERKWEKEKLWKPIDELKPKDNLNSSIDFRNFSSSHFFP
jgi:hypothetical protein